MGYGIRIGLINVVVAHVETNAASKIATRQVMEDEQNAVEISYQILCVGMKRLYHLARWVQN